MARRDTWLGLAVTAVAITGCQNSGHSVQSRADDFSSCLQKNGVEHGFPGYSSGSVTLGGQSVDLNLAEVSLLPKRGPGPPDKVALFQTDEAARTWADLTLKNVRDKGHAKRVVLFADEQAVLVTNNGVSPHRAVVEKCLGAL